MSPTSTSSLSLLIQFISSIMFEVESFLNNPNSNITLSKSIPLSFSSSTSTSILSRASQVSSSPSPALVISTFKTKPESSTLPAEQKEFMKTRFKSSLLLEFPVSDIVYNFVNSPTGKFEGTEVVAVIAEEVAPAARFDMLLGLKETETELLPEVIVVELKDNDKVSVGWSFFIVKFSELSPFENVKVVGLSEKVPALANPIINASIKIPTLKILRIFEFIFCNHS